jgi:large subunit ribosomal protein L29
MTKPAELRAMSNEQLELTLRDTIKNLFHLRVQSATERLETPSEIKKAKREVARIRTILREREIAAERQATTGGTASHG